MAVPLSPLELMEIQVATLYHGTSIASALQLLNGAPLGAVEAAAARIDGEVGFYLATEASDAEYFAWRRQGTILEYTLGPTAVESLHEAGAVRRPIPPGKATRFVGEELVVPVGAFGVFNQLLRRGEIHVRPHRG